MIHLDKRKWIYINIENPFKMMKKLRGIFKPLKKYFRCTFKEFDYYPVLWCSKPAFIHIISQDVMWKDKYDDPRFEVVPYIWIHIWKMNLVLYWDTKDHDSEDYWEQALWYLYYYHRYMYHKPDINKARENWPWKYSSTNKSTWNDDFLYD